MGDELKKKNLYPHVCVIAEAGSNWRRGTVVKDRRAAIDLIDAAVDAGADAVKFQTYRAATVYAPNAGMSDYLAANGIRKSIHEIFEDLSMPYEMIRPLAEHCRKRKIEFMSSAFSRADFEAVDPYVRTHKIASYEISHVRLLELAARSGKHVILSTGASDYRDIDWAVAYFRKHGGRKLSLMQCTAKYPSPVSALNLKVIPELIRRYRVPVGLSDHSRDPIIGPVAAVALGATLIEKHYTLDNRLPGPDHAFAVTAGELKQLVAAVRLASASLGHGRKELLPEEHELRAFARRSLQTLRPVAKGEIFKEGVNFDILRPGKRKQGIHPKFVPSVEGRRARRAIGAGDGIEAGDYGR